MARWMDIAWSQLGQQEVSGAAANPQIIEYFRTVGRPDVASDEVAWCAAFAGYCLKEGGVSIEVIPREERLRARAYLALGTPIDTPRPGALAIFSRGSDAEQGHVGFVAGATAEHIVLLGGNQASRVCTVHMARARLIGLRWPAPEAAAGDLAARGSRTVAAAGRQVRDGATGTGLQALQGYAPPKLPPADAMIAKASGLRSAVETAVEFSAFLGKKWPVMLLVVGGYFGLRVIYDAVRVRGFRVEDHNTGANVQTEPEAGDAAP